MPTLATPRWRITSLKPEILAVLPLALLVTGEWLTSNGIFDGQTIATTLTIITIVNLSLAGLLLSRMRRFAGVVLLVTYFFHLLYFLLYYFQRRAS